MFNLRVYQIVRIVFHMIYLLADTFDDKADKQFCCCLYQAALKREELKINATGKTGKADS